MVFKKVLIREKTIFKDELRKCNSFTIKESKSRKVIVRMSKKHSI